MTQALADELERLSHEVFALSLEACNAEIRRVNEFLRYADDSDLRFIHGFDDGENPHRNFVRPKFFTGAPCPLERGAYILAMSLNCKWEDPEDDGPTARAFAAEVQALNESAVSHFRRCSNYFDEGMRPHPHFLRRFGRIAQGFVGQQQPPDFALLRARMFFMEAVPYFSVASAPFPRDRDPRALEVPAMRLNARALDAVFVHCPPRAVLLAGSNTHDALAVRTEERTHLTSTTKAGPCAIWTGRLDRPGLPGDGIPVFKCMFPRTQAGPNSNAQLHEVGERLAQLGAA